MKKAIFITVVLALLFTGTVMAQSQDAPPIQDDDFAFGEFKLQQTFDKKLAEFIYGKGKEVNLSAKEVNYVSKVSKENKTYTGNYTVYFYKTASFMVQENKIIGAASTCEKGSNPRNLLPYSEASDVIKAYGEPLETRETKQGWQALAYSNTTGIDKPIFCIFVPNKEDEESFTERRKTIINWGTLPIFTSLCWTSLVNQEKFIKGMDNIKKATK